MFFFFCLNDEGKICWHFSGAAQPKHYWRWRGVAAADVELLLLLIIARFFFSLSDDNNGSVERKENHLRKSIFGFVADVDMEPCLQWLPSGCPVEMFLSSAELSQ